jgi:hypothetical protein
LSRKAVHNWVDKFSQGRLKVADDARPGEEMAETAVKRLVCCGFRRTGKAMGQMSECWWRICREVTVSSWLEYHITLLFISICDLFTDSLLFHMTLVCHRFYIFLFYIRRGAEKSLAFPICSTTKIIFLGWVKEVRTTKS